MNEHCHSTGSLAARFRRFSDDQEILQFRANLGENKENIVGFLESAGKKRGGFY
jgi:hypothetical protein